MKIVVISSKRCWKSGESPNGYATTGGFPFQMETLSNLFMKTTLLLPVVRTPPPIGIQQLTGNKVTINPLIEPPGSDLKRKIYLLFWLPWNIPKLWHQVYCAGAVHTPVPGDIGTIGLLVALAQRKPLFVRHCGTWGNRTTLADRFLDWLLPRIAGGRNVVMATGGGDAPPCPLSSFR